MKSLLSIVFCLITIPLIGIAQTPATQWTKCLGGSGDDKAVSVQLTSDGGFVVGANTTSTDGDVQGNSGMSDAWVAGVNATGAIQWQRCFGGSKDDAIATMQPTSDGGYVLAGVTHSNDGIVTGKHGASDSTADAWVVKLDDKGALVWQKCLGGSDRDEFSWVQQTGDGGYIVVGTTLSNDGDVSGNHGGADIWAVKLSATGAIQWQKCYGGSSGDLGASIQITVEGGYVLSGVVTSLDGDITGKHGGSDVWMAKLDATGTVEWKKCYGGNGNDLLSYVQPATVGGYFLGAVTFSDDGDIIGGIHGTCDVWFAKLSDTGSVEWQKSYGGSGSDYVYRTYQPKTIGYVLVGATRSNDGDATGLHGNGSTSDMWMARVLPTSALQFTKSIGGSDEDAGTDAQNLGNGGGWIVVGYTKSNDGDVSGNHGGYDVLLARVGGSGTGGGGVEYSSEPFNSVNMVQTTASQIEIDFTEPVRWADISITDVTGTQYRTIHAVAPDRIRLETGDLPSGTYLIQVVDERNRRRIFKWSKTK